jgi:hypothetical protein
MINITFYGLLSQIISGHFSFKSANFYTQRLIILTAWGRAGTL